MFAAIASKARPKATTYKLLEQQNIPFAHFVEPQDEALYRQHGIPNLHVIPKNDQGIGYVRNYILRWGKAQGHEWLWMLDDDVNAFGYAKAGKCIATDASVLVEFWERTHGWNFPASGINYRQYAWASSKQKTRIRVNAKPPDVCTLLHLPGIWWEFQEKFAVKADRDFYMRCIQHGKGILMDQNFWFNCPNVGSNAGGLQPLYQAKRDHHFSVMLHNEWKDYSKLIKKGERVDCRLDYKAYAKSLHRPIR
jgi:hypothetical protein